MVEKLLEPIESMDALDRPADSAVAKQPLYEVRTAAGRIEIRRAPAELHA